MRYQRNPLSAAPQQIKDHVKKNLDIMMPGGGFVFQQIHNIMANVPPQNIMAMFEAVHEYNG
jgi:uroporphyrinogen decarboxylase